MKEICGKILYGSLFILILPICLLVWQKELDQVIQGLPAINSPFIGSILIVFGGSILILGWNALMKHGKGLPMNAFPPKKLVSKGIFAIIPNPIYSGFTLIVAGYAILKGSAAGLWVVTPTIALCSIALVVGYERIDMKRRFGTNSWQTAIRLPLAKNQPPTISERISTYILVFLPWVLMYEAFIFLGPMPDAIDSYSTLERSMSVIEWTEIIYAFTYLFVLMAPLFAKRQADLRSYIIMGIWAIIIGALCFILLPFKATPRPFIPTGIIGQFLLTERSFDGPAGAFPAFHALWSFLSAWLYTKIWRKALLWYFIASLISLSCITTGMHSILDICGALTIFIIVLNRDLMWGKILRLTEWFANSWHDWRIGSIRIINHGFYVGAVGPRCQACTHLVSCYRLNITLHPWNTITFTIVTTNSVYMHERYI